MAEIAGLVLGSASFAISTIHAIASIRCREPVTFSNAYSNSITRALSISKEHGLITSVLLYALLPDALFVMDRVERYVLHVDDSMVIAFMKSYDSSFNMIGVAGAIVAQVAISAISLTRLEDTHWTAQAFFVCSLTTGALSVFFSCTLNPAFHGLHSPEDIKDFLTKPAPSTSRATYQACVSDLVKMVGPNIREADQPTFDDIKRELSEGRWKVPSAYAAIMLVTPMVLLRVALNAFLIGLGVYLGKMYTAELMPSYGKGSMGILCFYIISTLIGLCIYYIAHGLKQFENAPLKLWRKVEDDYRVYHVRADGISHVNPPANGDASTKSRDSRDGKGNQSAIVGNTMVEPNQKSTQGVYQHLDDDSSGDNSQENTYAILASLLKAQQESVRATERLLQVYKEQRV